MSVADTNAEYAKRLPQWTVMRDVSAGEDAVKAAGSDYLPMLGGQDRERYQAYVKRASFYNATGRTIDGLSGMIFRKPPVVETPEAMADFREDVTLSGVPLQGFAEQSVEEVLVAGRAGVMVDFPRVEDRGLTRADAERMNLRPFWTLYRAEDMLDWKVGIVGNRTTLLQVRLYEKVMEDDPADEFAEVEIEQVRVLELVAASPDGTGPQRYQQRLFRKNANTSEWEQFGEAIVPEMAGQPLDYIPFVFLGPRDTTAAVHKPPLIDLAHVNLSHYRTCADLEHGAHFTALPTPYVFGVDDKHVPTEIGPESVWHAPTSEVTVGLLEYEGTGLEALETRRQVKEEQMAALGARMLAPEKRQAEAAETAQIHRHGEISVLASLAQAVSAGLTRALEIARDWTGVSGEVGATLNTDFLPTPMDPQTLREMFRMVQGGRISQRVFFDNLKKGEVIDSERSFEEEEADRETEDALGLMEAPGGPE